MLKRLGGALLAATIAFSLAPDARAADPITIGFGMALTGGLAPNGKLIVVGADFTPIEVTPVQLIFGSRSIQGWAAGTPADTEETLRFAELSGVRPMLETYPLERAAEAYARMLSGDARFRVVLTM